MPDTYHFVGEDAVFRGATWSTGLGFDSGPPGAVVPLNLSGATDVLLSMKWRGGSLVKTLALGGLTLEPATGGVLWTLSATETLLFPIGRLTSYEIEARFASSQVSLVSGTIEAIGGLTNG